MRPAWIETCETLTHCELSRPPRQRPCICLRLLGAAERIPPRPAGRPSDAAHGGAPCLKQFEGDGVEQQSLGDGKATSPGAGSGTSRALPKRRELGRRPSGFGLTAKGRTGGPDNAYHERRRIRHLLRRTSAAPRPRWAVAHSHRERNHQGLGNELIIREPRPLWGTRVRCRERLGGLLRYYHSAA
jgi:hypothetical protein